MNKLQAWVKDFVIKVREQNTRIFHGEDPHKVFKEFELERQKSELNETAMMSESERKIIEESKKAKKAKENIIITPVSIIFTIFLMSK